MTVKEIYAITTKIGKYDLQTAKNQQTALFRSNLTAKEAPKAFYKITCEEKAGCCLNYALSMIYLMHSDGRKKAYLAATPEENPNTGERTHKHASVAYLKDGVLFFADPVKTVMGKEGDFSEISLKDFQDAMLKEGEFIDLYDPYSELAKHKLFFTEFMSMPETII